MRWKNTVVGSIVGLSMLAFGGLAGAGEPTNPNNELEAYPVTASIKPATQKKYGPTAATSWNLSWGGGNGRYNVSFPYGDGDGYYKNDANFTTYKATNTFSLGGGVTYKQWNQTLRVSSVGGSDTATSKVQHYGNKDNIGGGFTAPYICYRYTRR